MTGTQIISQWAADLLDGSFDGMASWELRENLLQKIRGNGLAILPIDERDRLREINAELLAALKAILPVYKDWTEDGGHDPSVGIDATADWIRIENAEAAIAKAESGQ